MAGGEIIRGPEVLPQVELDMKGLEGAVISAILSREWIMREQRRLRTATSMRESEFDGRLKELNIQRRISAIVSGLFEEIAPLPEGHGSWDALLEKEAEARFSAEQPNS